MEVECGLKYISAWYLIDKYHIGCYNETSSEIILGEGVKAIKFSPHDTEANMIFCQ